MQSNLGVRSQGMAEQKKESSSADLKEKSSSKGFSVHYFYFYNLVSITSRFFLALFMNQVSVSKRGIVIFKLIAFYSIFVVFTSHWK